MNQKKRHHFVPKAYLNSFKDVSGRILVYRKDKVADPLSVAPDATQFRRYYYSQPKPGGGVDNNALEDLFSTLESGWPEVVEKLHPRDSVNDHLELIFQFIALQRVRVPAARDLAEAIYAATVRGTMNHLARAGKLPPPPAEYPDLLDRVTISIDPHQSIHAMAWMMPGVPIRWVGWTLLLPALTWQPQKPGFGEWRLIALDVGQGGSVLLQTQNHTLLFDAGPKLGDSDAGQRVVIPLLRALGVRYLDTLVISHSDVDHAGGVPGILREIPVRETFSSFDLPQWLEHTERVLKLSKPVTRPPIMSACLADTQWEWDGVIFRVLHPQLEAVESLNNTSERPAKKKVRTNAKSCVLYVQGRQHAALMPGDIGVKQEESLMQNMSLKSDVVVVPHHGSLTSSAPVFVTNLQAQHAIAQSGYLNRFSHPAHEVERRWRQAKTEFWRTDNHGAVTVESSETGLRVYTESVRRKRYWHQRD